MLRRLVVSGSYLDSSLAARAELVPWAGGAVNDTAPYILRNVRNPNFPSGDDFVENNFVMGKGRPTLSANRRR